MEHKIKLQEQVVLRVRVRVTVTVSNPNPNPYPNPNPNQVVPLPRADAPGIPDDEPFGRSKSEGELQALDDSAHGNNYFGSKNHSASAHGNTYFKPNSARHESKPVEATDDAAMRRV